MKKLVFAFVALGTLSAPAGAGLVCASAPELKVLQSTALQQQLMVAALTCHLREDYNRFVTAYRDGLVQSDAALKAFFASRPRGENYNAYKTRIANAASLRSVHDSRFCDSARKVFDMALGRRLERRGLAPEPPQLVDTGYEGCRAVDDAKLIEARVRPVAAVPKPRPAPAAKLAAAPASLQMVKPVPAPKPVVTAEAVRALAPRPQFPVKQTASQPVRVAAAPKPVPMPVAQKPAAAKSVVAAKVAAQPPLAKIASAAPLPQPVGPRALPVPPPRRSDWGADDPGRPAADEDPSRFEETELATLPAPPRRDAETPQRYAAPARQSWQTQAADVDDPYADNPIPNAYRPGAEWVGDGDPDWRPVRYDHAPPRGAYWVLDPYGRWVLVVPHGPRWGWR
jgi:hypothetical protein